MDSGKRRGQRIPLRPVNKPVGRLPIDHTRKREIKHTNWKEFDKDPHYYNTYKQGRRSQINREPMPSMMPLPIEYDKKNDWRFFYDRTTEIDRQINVNIFERSFTSVRPPPIDKEEKDDLQAFVHRSENTRSFEHRDTTHSRLNYDRELFQRDDIILNRRPINTKK